MRIRQKLMLVIFVFILLNGTIGYWAIQISRKVLAQSIGESSTSLVCRTLSQIEEKIYSKIEIFQEYSKSPALQKRIAESNQKFNEINNVQAYINQKDKEWISAPKPAITPFMQKLLNDTLSQEIREKVKFYEEKYQYKVFGEVFVTNKYGANVIQTGMTSDYYQADEQWWQAAKEKGLYIEDVEYDESADVFSTDIGIRIDDKSGNFIGVIKVVLNIEKPISIIREAKRSSKYETIQYELITKNGKSIYSTEKGRLFENMTEVLDNRLCKECQDKHGGHLIIKSDIPGEENVLCAHAHLQGLRGFESLGWILILKLHAREILAPVAKLIKQLIIISIIIAVITFLTGAYITSNISAPLLKLRDAAIEIGKGNLNAQFEIKSNDEVGQLAASFKKMVEDLGETTTSIDTLANEMVERKKAQEELARKRNLLRMLMDTLPDQIFAKDINGTFVFNNTSCARNLGVESPKDVVGKTDFDFFSREQAAESRANEQQIMQTGQLLRQEVQVHNKVDDATKWFSIRKVPWRDDDGNVIGIVGLVCDITDRKQMEQALKNEKNRAHNYIDAAEVIILALDTDQKVRLINRKGCEVLGHNEKDVIGKDWCENFIPEPNRDEVRLVLSKLLREKIEVPHYYENPVLTESRQERLVAWRNTILYDNKEGVSALLSSGEDITDRRQAEKNLKTAYIEIEDANKNLKEMQSQLVQNEKLASIGQLAAGVAHEMNTPVGFVASNFQTLESYVKKFKSIIDMCESLMGQIDTLQKKEIRKEIDEIRQAWDDMKMDFILKDIQQVFKESEEGFDRITSIIKNLKDFSRIDQVEDFEQYNINDGIEATLIVAKNEIKYDADLETDFTELPPIFCYAGQLNQVFLNIIVNAAQAIKSQERQDKGTITIKTYATEDNVICEIADDGPGIAPDKLSKIFDPFFTTKPVGKGTGLGLSVSHDIIVNKHKGRLLVDSTVGEGTTFTIKLPIKTLEQNTKKETVHSGNQDCTIC